MNAWRLGRQSCFALLAIHVPALPGCAAQAVGATPESVLLLDSPSTGKDSADEGVGTGALFLQVGRGLGGQARTACLQAWAWRTACAACQQPSGKKGSGGGPTSVPVSHPRRLAW